MTGLFPSRWHGGHAILAGLGLLCLFLAARLVLAGPPALPDMPAVARPGMADPGLLARHDLFFGPAAAGEALPVTSLPISLHGLRTDAATGRGGAIIAGADGLQNSYQVGENVGEGAVLVSIAFDHVVLEREGRREALWLDNAGETPLQSYDPGAAGGMGEPAAAAMAASDDGATDAPTGAADLPAAPSEQEGTSG